MSKGNTLTEHSELKQETKDFFDFLNKKVNRENLMFQLLLADGEQLNNKLIHKASDIARFYGNPYDHKMSEQLVNNRVLLCNTTGDDANQILNIHRVIKNFIINPPECINQDTLIDTHMELQLNKSSLQYGKISSNLDVDIDSFNKGIYNTSKMPFKSIGTVADYCNTIESPYEKAIYLIDKIRDISTSQYGGSGLNILLGSLTLTQANLQPLLPNVRDIAVLCTYITNSNVSDRAGNVAIWFEDFYLSQFVELLGKSKDKLKEEFNEWYKK